MCGCVLVVCLAGGAGWPGGFVCLAGGAGWGCCESSWGCRVGLL